MKTTSKPRRTSRRFQVGSLGVIALALVILVIQADRHPRAALEAQVSTKLDLALQPLATAGGDQQVRVIVSAFSGRVEDAAQAVAQRGDPIMDRFASIGAVTTVIRADQLTALAGDWRVRSLSSDGMVESAQYTSQAAGGNGRGNGGGGGNTTTDPEPDTTTDTTDGVVTDAPVTDEAPADEGWQTASLAENHVRNTLGLKDGKRDGGGVFVAVIDSGIAQLPDMHKIFRFYDFTNGKRPRVNRGSEPFDDYGHGSHVAGLIANEGDFSEGLFRGVVPKVRLIGLKVLDREGVGYTSDVVRALEFVIDNLDRLPIDVINLSLGHPILEAADRDPLVQAVEAAVRAGVVVVVSAGNYGYNRDTGEVGYAGISSPGNAPSAITVGAIDTRQTDSRGDDVVARFSSRGPTWYDGYAKPDLVAPGSQLFSAVSTSSDLYLDNPSLTLERTTFHGDSGHYMKLSGTSMATAVTTGVVAAMFQANRDFYRILHNDDGGNPTPKLSPNAIKAMLQYSALDLPDHDVLTQGAGGLNGDGAIALASNIDSTTAVGQWWLTQGVSENSTIAGTNHTWSQRLVWGDRLIWGNLDDGTAGTMGVR